MTKKCQPLKFEDDNNSRCTPLHCIHSRTPPPPRQSCCHRKTHHSVELNGFNYKVLLGRIHYLLKAIVFPIVHHGIEHGADVLQAAGGELVVVLSVARGGGREHDEVATSSTRTALHRVIVRRAEVVADLVGEGELGDFGRNPAVVVDEGDDAGVEAALGGVVDSVHILSVGFVLFTDAPTSSTC